ncbi:MAG: hypothetical protein ACKV2U_05030 [Bryobacteraceae bacterium]
MAFAFPLFFGRAVLDPKGAALPEWTGQLPPEMANDPTIRRQFALHGQWRRRYSGDRHSPLPRLRYMALSPTSSGVVPSYGLLGELNAYAVPRLTGYCAATPIAGRNEISLVFRGLPGEPNPLYRFVTEPQKADHLLDGMSRDLRSLVTPAVVAAVPPGNEFSLVLPYDDVQVPSERVFDMRLPTARGWMVDFFRNPPPAETDEDLAHGEWLKIIAEMYEVDLRRIEGWRQLLPIVCGNSQGGNAMTDVFAAFLRRMGCTGIIYPSARSDHGVLWEDGHLKEHWGWHFVDYTGSPIPTRLSPEYEQPLLPLQGVYHMADIKQGRFAGSLAVVGGSLYTRLYLQMQFDLYALSRVASPTDYQDGHLCMRSYCWYRRDYCAPFDAVICDSCATPFSFREVGPLRRCPSCRFGGALVDLAYVSQVIVPYLTQLGPVG